MNDRKGFRIWAHKNICWCRAAAIVSVLLFGYNVVHYTIVTVLITFFTKYPNDFKLVKAARYVNLMDAATVSFGIVVDYMSDALFSHFKIIGCSILSTIAGLLLFYVNLIFWGNYDLLYMIGMLLLAAGEATFSSLLSEFLEGQLRGHEQNTNTKGDRVESPSEDRVESSVEDRVEDRRADQEESQKEDQAEDRVKAQKKVWLIFALVPGVIATFVISNYSWEVIFFTSTLKWVGIFILFMFGIPFYHCTDFGGDSSSTCNFIHVIKASLLNRHLNYPSSPDHFHENYGSQLHLYPHVKILRWLDKAAIIESPSLNTEDQKRTGRLCTVTQVEESKHLLNMIPMWSAFLVVGLVSSTGHTFSKEQGKNLNHTDFTFYIFLFIKPISTAAICFLYNKLLNPNRCSKAQQKLGKIMRIWFGMVLSTIFCTVAWRVEAHRLQIVRRKRENPGKLIHNMSIFRLAPQYCLLGLMEGSSIDGLEKFMIGELPNSLNKYVSALNGLVIDGLGSILSILYVIANEKLFGDTINDSRLDKYYLRLSFLSFLNMCYYYPISIFYRPIHYTQANIIERDITINHILDQPSTVLQH